MTSPKSVCTGYLGRGSSSLHVYLVSLRDYFIPGFPWYPFNIMARERMCVLSDESTGSTSSTLG